MARRRTTEADYQARIQKAARWLEGHLDGPIEPSDVAREASFSLHHFHRIFRAQLGESVMEHVRRLRLERAARKLRTGDARILELAIEAGYDSHEAFTRAFVERFGVTPSHFREAPSTRLTEWRAQPPRPAGPVTVRHIPPLRAARMRHRGGYQGIDALWARMYAWIASHLPKDQWPDLYGACPDDYEVTPMHLLRFDACAVLPEGVSFEGDAEADVTEIGGGTYAVGVHRGSYMKLSDTYLDVIGRWFPSSGYDLTADPVLERYLNDPKLVAEHELLTEVCVRIAEE